MLPALHHLFEYRLEPEICSFRMLKAVADFAKDLGVKNYPVHIKIDTGMHRAGFENQDISKIIDFFNSQDELKICSVFSHLAAADEDTPEMNNFTIQQINLFEKITATLEKSISYKFFKHILNTAGIERFSEYQFDMVRLGIGLWGFLEQGTKSKEQRQEAVISTNGRNLVPEAESKQILIPHSSFLIPKLKNVCSLINKNHSNKKRNCWTINRLRQKGQGRAGQKNSDFAARLR